MYKTNFFSSINNTVSQYLKEIKLDILYGFSIYDLFKLYIIGIIKGTISNRASSISFSFFMALFPFILFVLNLIPFIPKFFNIENFDAILFNFIETILPQDTHTFFEKIFEDIK